MVEAAESFCSSHSFAEAFSACLDDDDDDDEAEILNPPGGRQAREKRSNLYTTRGPRQSGKSTVRRRIRSA